MADLDKITKKPLGQLLVEEGVVTNDQVQEALRQQMKSGELLGELLVRNGFTTETDIAKTLCQQFGKPFIRVTLYDMQADAISAVPPRLMIKHGFIPLDKYTGLLVIAIGGILDAATIAQIRMLAGSEVDAYISTPTDVSEMLRKKFPNLYDPITRLPFAEKEADVTGAMKAPELPEDDDDMGETTREFVGVAEDESDWESLFEEAEKNVLKELKDDRDDSSQAIDSLDSDTQFHPSLGSE